jgi:hypothetical protein
VNVNWLPSPFYNRGRSGYAIRGVVNHRIVGTLGSARGAFGAAPGTPRNASTHFGIGYISGVLTIDQFVDLSDMAWGNGDVRDPTWPLIIPGVNPNLYTVSIEHEDGGSAGRGVVKEPIWQASMALQKLITSGDLTAVRAAGIHVRDEASVRQLQAVPKDAKGFIDHNQISGPNKPYCFRRWLDDPGFVDGSPSRRTRLLTHLTSEDEMQFRNPIVTQDWDTVPGEASTFTRPDGSTGTFTAKERVKSIAEGTINGVDSRLLDYGPNHEALVIGRKGLTNPGPRIVGSPIPTGITQAQLDAAVAAARVDTKTKAVMAVQGI